MVVLGRRIAKGGGSAEAEPSPLRSDRGRGSATEPRSAGREVSYSKNPAAAGVGALRGVPARKGCARHRLARGERLFPGEAHPLAMSHPMFFPKKSDSDRTIAQWEAESISESLEVDGVLSGQGHASNDDQPIRSTATPQRMVSVF